MTSRENIILAGGTGTRLHLATLAISKLQLLMVDHKLTICHLLSTLRGTRRFEQLLGDGR